MTKKLFDLSDDDLAALDRVKANMGLTTRVETLRALIRAVDAAGAAPVPPRGVDVARVLGAPGQTFMGAARDALTGEALAPRGAKPKKAR